MLADVAAGTEAPLAPGFALIQKLRRLSAPVNAAAVQADPRPARAGLARLVAAYQPPMPPDVTMHAHPACGPIGVREFRPATLRNPIPVLYVHGGGFVFHGLASFAPVLATLASASGRPVIALDYPKVPEAQAAAIVAGLGTALDGLARAAGPGVPVLAGDSIGGLIVLWAALSALRDLRPKLVLVYPLLDLTEDRRFDSRERYGADAMLDTELLTYFRGLARGALPGFDPLGLSDADLAALGPVRILSAAHDVLADEAALFEDRLHARGSVVQRVTMPDLPHDFLLYGGRIPEAAAGLRLLGRMLLA